MGLLYVGPAAVAVAVVHPLATDWSARRVASLLVYRPEELSELQQTYRCRLCHADPAIAEASQLATGFLRLVRERGSALGGVGQLDRHGDGQRHCRSSSVCAWLDEEHMFSDIHVG